MTKLITINNRKLIFSNLVSFGLIEVLGLLIPIITMPILVKSLGMDIYGIFILLITIIGFGNTFIDYGVQYTGVRDASRVKENTTDLKAIYEKTQGMRLFILFIYYALSSLYVYTFIEIEIEIKFYFYFYGFISLMSSVLTSAWFYQSIGKVKILLYSTFISRIVSLTLIYFWIKEPSDIWLAFFAQTVPSFIAAVFVFLLLYRKYKINININIDSVFRELKKGINIFLGILAPNIYNTIPFILLGSFIEPAKFALLAIGIRLGSVLYAGMNVVAKSIFPVIAGKEIVKIRGLIFFNVLFSLLQLSIVYGLGEFAIFSIFGDGYEDVYNYLVILSISLLFVAISNALSQGYFIINKLDRIFRDVSIGVSILAAILTTMLIYFFGVIGFVYGIFGARLLTALCYLTIYQKTIKRNYS